MKNASTGKPETNNQTNWAQLSLMTDADINHDVDSPVTTEADWEDAFACHNAYDLHNETTRRTRGAGKHPTKE